MEKKGGRRKRVIKKIENIEVEVVLGPFQAVECGTTRPLVSDDGTELNQNAGKD